MIQIPSIADCQNLTGKRILLRLDLNVPMAEGKIRDAYRIEKSLPTINFLREHGARVIIISHIGAGDEGDTLLPVAEYMRAKFPVSFLHRLESVDNERVTRSMVNGDVVMIENLRHTKKEEANDISFAEYLASLGDIYVNDAFSVSHRTHASVVALAALLPHYAGLQLMEEVSRIALAFEPERPFLFVLGGAKISTKMSLLKKFINIADHVFVGGAIVNNLLKAKGHEIGMSLYDAEESGGLEVLLENPRIILPTDVVVKNSAGSEVKKVTEVGADDTIVDIGPETIHHLEGVVGGAKLIVWNGPLGFYEEGFTDGTRELLGLVGGSHATSIVGGGDTVALIDELQTANKFSFISTGGGAMLDYLANETLPGIDALRS
jgi:phosphoglycerate kinase